MKSDTFDGSEIWRWITTTWHLWNPAKSWDICFTISTGCLDFFSINIHEIQKKQPNQIQNPTKGAWCNLLRVPGVLPAPLASQVLRSMAPLPVSALMGWWDPVLLLRCMAAQKQAVDPIKKTVSLQTLDQLNINKRCLLYINCNIKRHIQHECHIRTVVYLLKHSEPLLMIILQPTPANMLWHISMAIKC